MKLPILWLVIESFCNLEEYDRVPNNTSSHVAVIRTLSVVDMI